VTWLTELLPYEINLANSQLESLVGLWRSHHEGSIGAQDPLDPRNKIDGPGDAQTLYIYRKPYFLKAPPIATKLPPRWLAYPRERAHLQHQGRPRKNGARGCRPLWLPPSAAAGAAASLAVCTVASASPPLEAPLHHPHYNLLANKIFEAIYYIPVICCVAMSCVKWLLVHDNDDIVCFDGCIHVCDLLWWFYVLMYKCMHMLGNCMHKVFNVRLTWSWAGEWQKHVPDLSSIHIGGWRGLTRQMS
jgi:hypothetical protein